MEEDNVYDKLSRHTKVLVTGAAGFVASHVVLRLVQAGCAVRGTVRSLSSYSALALSDLFPDLELVAADLRKDGGWEEAVEGCTYVVHVAAENVLHDVDSVSQVVQGMQRVLRACKMVQRVVVTSCITAINGELDSKSIIYTEEDWSDITSVDHQGVCKMLSERAAWEIFNGHELPFEMAVINPGWIIGPLLISSFGQSVNIIKHLLDGNMAFCPRLNFAFCDVRDVAEAHFRALVLPEANGQRHIIVTQNLWLKDVSKIMAKTFRPLGYKVPTLQIIKPFSWLMSPFFKGYFSYSEGSHHFSNERMIHVLGILPRFIEDSIIDTAFSLIELGLVKKTTKYKESFKEREKIITIGFRNTPSDTASTKTNEDDPESKYVDVIGYQENKVFESTHTQRDSQNKTQGNASMKKNKYEIESLHKEKYPFNRAYDKPLCKRESIRVEDVIKNEAYLDKSIILQTRQVGREAIYPKKISRTEISETSQKSEVERYLTSDKRAEKSKNMTQEINRSNNSVDNIPRESKTKNTTKKQMRIQNLKEESPILAFEEKRFTSSPHKISKTQKEEDQDDISDTETPENSQIIVESFTFSPETPSSSLTNLCQYSLNDMKVICDSDYDSVRGARKSCPSEMSNSRNLVAKLSQSENMIRNYIPHERFQGLECTKIDNMLCKKNRKNPQSDKTSGSIVDRYQVIRSALSKLNCFKGKCIEKKDLETTAFQSISCQVPKFLSRQLCEDLLKAQGCKVIERNHSHEHIRERHVIPQKRSASAVSCYQKYECHKIIQAMPRLEAQTNRDGCVRVDNKYSFVDYVKFLDNALDTFSVPVSYPESDECVPKEVENTESEETLTTIGSSPSNFTGSHYCVKLTEETKFGEKGNKDSKVFQDLEEIKYHDNISVKDNPRNIHKEKDWDNERYILKTMLKMVEGWSESLSKEPEVPDHTVSEMSARKSTETAKSLDDLLKLQKWLENKKPVEKQEPSSSRCCESSTSKKSGDIQMAPCGFSLIGRLPTRHRHSRQIAGQADAVSSILGLNHMVMPIPSLLNFFIFATCKSWQRNRFGFHQGVRVRDLAGPAQPQDHKNTYDDVATLGAFFQRLMVNNTRSTRRVQAVVLRRIVTPFLYLITRPARRMLERRRFHLPCRRCSIHQHVFLIPPSLLLRNPCGGHRSAASPARPGHPALSQPVCIASSSSDLSLAHGY
ncbi:hypothetical protein LAZ67_6003996 [Cordylochernes scorpioides]|uniref:NAD-dependent epimerase/dehydratase domain-containing protein n=1 Tax=Cordylochernes scorpioides TaxID=51811 RepID=A0ABY6KR37_9ARAC|nr:hypothetical protein LAZ67_6003996 [Cordylochernes scorpioides]